MTPAHFRRLLLLCLLALTASAQAHPFDKVVPSIDVTVDPLSSSVTIKYKFIYRTLDASYLEQTNGELGLDTDGDGKISGTELRRRVEQYLRETASQANLRVDNELVPVKGDPALSGVHRVDSLPIEKVGNWLFGYYLVLRGKTTDKLGPGRHSLSFYNAETRIKSSSPTGGMRGFVLTRDPDTDTGRMEQTQVKDARIDKADGRFDLIVFEFEVPESAGNESVPIDTTAGEGQREIEEAYRTGTPGESEGTEHVLRGLVNEVKGWGWAALMAFIGIFVLGMWHGIQPGHGKTLVAAYLIGTYGRPRDALTLGVTVTLAHTSGVFLLLAGLWILSSFFPELSAGGYGNALVQNILVTAVGTVIFLMGIGLVLKRTGGGQGHQHDLFGRHLDGHDHDHSHDHPHDHSHKGDSAHDHNAHSNAELDPKKMSTWEVVRLGILGGLLPCPTGLVLALLTISEGEYGLGFVLLVVFSAGLATVLALIGLVLVATKSYLKKKHQAQSRLVRAFERYVPTLGALAITLLGFALLMGALARLGVLDLAKLIV